MPYKFLKENHLHEIDGIALIGTSTVMSVLAKPLTWWASGLAMTEFGWRDPKKTTPEECEAAAIKELETLKEMNLISYRNKLAKGYRAHVDSLNKSASKGTDLHAELERFVKDSMDPTKEFTEKDYDERIRPFIEWSALNVEKFLWSELHCYSQFLWVGGISDCGALLKTGKLVIIDFKSSKEAYPSHFFQMAGYDIEISENGGYTADGRKIFTLDQPIDGYIVFPFGATTILPAYSFETDKNRDAFRCALTLYKIMNKIT